jgi:murein DD-endopeptidase MepM/ murein hydrolase activator NlpD
VHRLFRSNKAKAWVLGLFLFLSLLAVPATASTPQPVDYQTVAIEHQHGTYVERGSLSTRDARPTAKPTHTQATPLPTPVPPKKQEMGYVIPPPTPEPTPMPTPEPVATVAAHTSGAQWPLPGFTVITTYFSAAHEAVDIQAPCGTPALAVWSGTIIYAGWKDNGGGNVVDIQFDNGHVGSYNHLSAILLGVGTHVGKATPVGLVGMTGVATGCHLHFGLQVNGVWVDPLGYI